MNQKPLAGLVILGDLESLTHEHGQLPPISVGVRHKLSGFPSPTDRPQNGRNQLLFPKGFREVIPDIHALPEILLAGEIEGDRAAIATNVELPFDVSFFLASHLAWLSSNSSTAIL
jgi:hypothetical protein